MVHDHGSHTRLLETWLGTGPVAVETVPAALWVVTREPTSIEAVLSTASDLRRPIDDRALRWCHRRGHVRDGRHAWLARAESTRSLIELADRLVARRVEPGGAVPESS
jgi:hypothetical protein